jgi:flagellar brake protein
MGMTLPFPEPESPELERFKVYARPDILELLHALRDRQTPVTLYCNAAASFVVSTVVAVEPALEEVIFECADDRAAQDALCAATDVVVVAFLDSAKLQFTVDAVAEPVTHQGNRALSVRLPKQLLRMERRSAPRRRTPVGRQPTCLVPVLDAPRRYESVQVMDISAGGLSMLVHSPRFDLTADRVLQPCYVDLPDVGQVTVALRVRYVDPAGFLGGSRRCGCEFVEPGEESIRSVQSYIDKLGGEQTGLLSRQVV